MEQAKETLRFGAEVAKVLKLMIHSLYTNRDIFLRELISNASDACDKLRYQGLTRPELLSGGADFKITLGVDKEARTLTIADNGIGMSREELIANLGTIAKSGTQEFLSELGDKKDASLIGQFGVGFYSAFMAADKVTVTSTRAGGNETWRWESAGEGEFEISQAETATRGTQVTLHLKAGEDDYLDAFRLKHIVQTYSDHIAFPIEMEGEKLNRGLAIWMQPKAEVTQEQYEQFYRHVAHLPDAPWLTLHHKAEGALEFNALLFIPSLKPFDLFHPERKRRVKLYVKRVFITDEGVDLVPQWLRFLRGVVDSEDLPLNISRETLQGSPVLAKIREAVTKKVLSELKKRVEKDAADYDTFWERFGAVLKEGLCEGGSPREAILEVCRFNSTHGAGLCGMEEYIGRMKPGQEEIYYLTADSIEAARSSAQLEGFAKRGVEVLLLADHVDDFWLTVVQEFRAKKFKSVTRADVDLSKVGEAKDSEEKKEISDTQVDQLIARFKQVLGERVRDVRATNKLTDSAVCLAVEEGAMDMRLERFLIEQKQLPAGTPKILEINPEHPVLKALAAKLGDAAAEKEIDDVAHLLLDQARVMEGEDIGDPAAFAKRVNYYLARSLAA